jgi:hypothetical protein
MGTVIVGPWNGSGMAPTKLYIIIDGRTGRMIDRPYKFKHHAAKRMLAMGGWPGAYFVCSVAAVPEIIYSRNDDGTLCTEVPE